MGQSTSTSTARTVVINTPHRAIGTEKQEEEKSIRSQHSNTTSGLSGEESYVELSSRAASTILPPLSEGAVRGIVSRVAYKGDTKCLAVTTTQGLKEVCAKDESNTFGLTYAQAGDLVTIQPVSKGELKNQNLVVKGGQCSPDSQSNICRDYPTQSFVNLHNHTVDGTEKRNKSK